MHTCWYIVIELRGDWFVDFEGKAFGPFRTKEEAILDGTRRAREHSDRTRQAEVWVRDTAKDKPRQLWVGPKPATNQDASRKHVA